MSQMMTEQPSNKWFYKDLNISYNNVLSGSTNFGTSYFNDVATYYPGRKFDRVLEWCAGPGVIGFGLFADGICNNVHFIEPDNFSVDMLKTTIKNNNLTHAVTIHHTDKISDIPENTLFDLIVSNPPNRYSDFNITNESWRREHISTDKDSYSEFFGNIKTRLTSNGVILLMENVSDTDPSDFREMIKSNGLKILNIKRCTKASATDYCYLEIVHQEFIPL